MKPEFEKIEVALDTSLRVGIFTAKKTCKKVKWHFHPEYEIVYIKNGYGYLQIDKYHREYQDGVLLFIGPNTPHMPFGNKVFDDRLEVVVQFTESFIEEKISLFPEFTDILNLVTQSKKGLIFNPAIKQKLGPLFEKLAHLNATERLLSVLQILDVLSKTQSYSALKTQGFNPAYKARDVERINFAFEYVYNSYHKEISTADVAEHLGLTTNSFCRLFKKATHKTFMQFINDFRLHKAATMLLSKPSLSVSEVMYQCGFNDHSYFTKQFKKLLGVPPSEYIRQRLKEHEAATF